MPQSKLLLYSLYYLHKGKNKGKLSFNNFDNALQRVQQFDHYAILEQIDRDANEMMELLTTQMAKAEGVTEALKAQDQMEWGAGLLWRPLPQAEAPTEPAGETLRMNNIKNRDIFRQAQYK